jgi:hypothetical protein
VPLRLCHRPTRKSEHCRNICSILSVFTEASKELIKGRIFERYTEPDLYRVSGGQASFDGAQVGRDFITLHKLLQQYPSLVNSSVIGPDIATVTDRLAPGILTG